MNMDLDDPQLIKAMEKGRKQREHLLELYVAIVNFKKDIPLGLGFAYTKHEMKIDKALKALNDLQE